VYVPGALNVHVPVHGDGIGSCGTGGIGYGGLGSVLPCVTTHEEGFGLSKSKATLWTLPPPAGYRNVTVPPTATSTVESSWSVPEPS
jgi:hypothetical protein